MMGSEGLERCPFHRAFEINVIVDKNRYWSGFVRFCDRYTADDGFGLPPKILRLSPVQTAGFSKNGYYYSLADDPAIFSLSASPVVAATPNQVLWCSWKPDFSGTRSSSEEALEGIAIRALATKGAIL
jgi:hypothetical protein